MPLKRKLGTHALLILAWGIPSLATVMVGGALLLFGLEYILCSLLVVGVGVPMAGAGLVNRHQHGRDTV